MNIKELAKKSGLTESNNDGIRIETGYWVEELTRFAALVAAHEREECAALCFLIWNKWLDTPKEDRHKVLYDAEDCADAIRARGTR
jgi:hypothetical protein